VAAIRFLIEHTTASGPFNLTAPRPVTNAEFSRALGRALRRPAVLRLPGFVLRLALGEMADVLLTGQRAIPERLLDAGFTFRYVEVEAALADLLR
jgi:NAD dependent epimerase/dehydratase family enzyme